MGALAWQCMTGNGLLGWAPGGQYFPKDARPLTPAGSVSLITPQDPIITQSDPIGPLRTLLEHKTNWTISITKLVCWICSVYLTSPLESTSYCLPPTPGQSLILWLTDTLQTCLIIDVQENLTFILRFLENWGDHNFLLRTPSVWSLIHLTLLWKSGPWRSETVITWLL